MNKRVILGALMIICSAGILTPVGIVIIFWEYFKKAIKIDFYTVYLIMRLLVWAVIQLPLGILKVGTEGISSVLHKGISVLTEKPKLNALIFVASLAVFSFVFPNLLMSPSDITNIGAIMSSLWSFLLIIGFATLTTILLDTLYAMISSEDIATIDPRRTSMTDHYAGMKEGFQESGRGVKEGRKVYRDIEPEKATEEVIGTLMFWKQPDIQAVIGELGELLPGVNVKGAGAKKAAERYGAEALETAEMGTVGPVLIVAFLFVVVQWVIVIVLVGSYLQLILPFVASPLMGALGLGADYGNYFGGEVGDKYLAGMQVNVDQHIGPVLEARQRVYCLLQGPACMRQWRLNNTQNPGSESVGEEYSLNIDRLEIGSGNQLDIAYNDGDYEIPISFGLSNSRNGLKGINAYNVSYRMKMIDFNRDRDDPYCDTGWAPIDGYDIHSWDGFDSETADENWGENDLYPGTAASTGFLTRDDFDLEDCGLLQPGAGETRTVLLEVKYDYFSQATLYFDAMAQQTLLSDPSIKKDWKQSETADTPVKSALNVNSPVLFDQEAVQQGEDAAQPFSMRASLYTERSDVEYKVKNLSVTKSSQVDLVQGGNQRCSFEEKGGNKLVPKGSATDILAGSEEGQDRWFTSSNSPPFVGCTMELSNPAGISPEGETLTMGVESNYTVKLNEQLERFEAVNSQCSEFNCPLLVTLQFAEEGDRNTDNWQYTCEGPDAGRTGGTEGCSVVKGDPSDWSNIELLTGDDKLDSRLERGEIAIDPVRYEEIDVIEDYKEKENKFAVGLTSSQIEKLENSVVNEEAEGFAMVSIKRGDEREMEIRELDYIACEGRTSVEDYQEYFRTQVIDGGEDGKDKLISFSPVAADCDNLEDSHYATAADDASRTLAFGAHVYLAEVAARGTFDAIVDAFSDEKECDGFKAYDISSEEVVCPADS